MIGTTEWFIIGGIIVLLFGANKLVSWAKAIGQAKKAFEDEVSTKKEAEKSSA